MAPVLFLFIIMVALDLFDNHKVITHPINFMFTPKETRTLSLKEKTISVERTKFIFDKSAYADDVTLAFGIREYI